MSVSIVSSSFSPAVFFKAMGEALPQFSRAIMPIALATGISIGISACGIRDIQKLNGKLPSGSYEPEVKRSISWRARSAIIALSTTATLGCIGTVFRSPAFGILTAGSLVFAFSMVQLIHENIHDKCYRLDIRDKMKENMSTAVNCAFKGLVATALFPSVFLVAAGVHGLMQKNFH